MELIKLYSDEEQTMGKSWNKLRNGLPHKMKILLEEEEEYRMHKNGWDTQFNGSFTGDRES